MYYRAGEIQEMNELITRGLDYKPKSFGDLVLVFELTPLKWQSFLRVHDETSLKQARICRSSRFTKLEICPKLPSLTKTIRTASFFSRGQV